METAAALKPKGSKNKTKATPSQEASPETSTATTAAVTTKKVSQCGGAGSEGVARPGFDPRHGRWPLVAAAATHT